VKLISKVLLFVRYQVEEVLLVSYDMLWWLTSSLGNVTDPVRYFLAEMLLYLLVLGLFATVVLV
jgi:hypothetical protein